MIGTIAKLMDQGFGFITVEGQEKDLFFHATELEEGVDFNSLKEGQPVEFEMGEGPKGPQAKMVKLVEAAA
ncbi:MAG: CspA family cold shock protein [Candidatus Paceibacteria bacterium]|jgi:CspA family cold shock protein